MISNRLKKFSSIEDNKKKRKEQQYNGRFVKMHIQ